MWSRTSSRKVGLKESVFTFISFFQSKMTIKEEMVGNPVMTKVSYFLFILQ